MSWRIRFTIGSTVFFGAQSFQTQEQVLASLVQVQQDIQTVQDFELIPVEVTAKELPTQ